MITPIPTRRRGPLGRTLLVLATVLLGSRAGQAQTVDTYTFAPSTGTYTALPATATAVPDIQDDDVLSGNLPLGFSFVFDGNTYTSCAVSSNGWLTFNPTAASSSLNNDLATGSAAERPRVAPFWDDLNGSSGATASYLTTGTAPNRVFTFEWLNWYRYGSTGPGFSMQVQLVEGTNVVRFVYRQQANLTTNATASIGLSGVGTGTGSFLSLNGSSAAPTASSTTETTSISTTPATGQVYSFTPPPLAPCVTPRNLTATAITATSALLNWTVTSGTGPFTVQYGPTGFNPALPSSATNLYTTVSTTSGTSTTVTGLTASTGYMFYVTQNCGGTNGNSNRSNAGSFQTACLTPNYAALPVAESFENTWISRCDTREVPSNNWRNSPATGDGSWRREDDGVAGAWNSISSYGYTPSGSQGAHSARFHSGQAPSGTIGTLDLFVNLSAAGAKRLTFDFINTNGVDSLVVQISANGGATFSRLAGYNLSGAGAAFVTQVLPISSTSATAVIRFRGRADYGVTDIGLDNIILESATGCLTPATLTASVTPTTATLSWLTGGPGTYTVQYGPTGFNPALPVSGTNVYTTVAGLAGPPFTVSGLTSATTYQFYVTQNCAASTTSGTAGPATFTTQITNDEPCTATVLPVNNSCTPVNGTTYGATTTPPSGYSNAGTCAGFNTTPLDVWFRFTTAATGPTSTAIRISVTGGAAEIVRGFSGSLCSGNLTSLGCTGTGSGTAAPNLDLNNLTPSTTYFVRVSNYNSFQPVLGPFTICAVPVPNCPAPAGLTVSSTTNTTATVSWAATSGGAGSTFTVFYGPTGFVPPAGGTTVAGNTGSSTTLTGLTANTAYQFYVQQVCGGFNGSSGLVGPVGFSTPLTAPANDEPCGATALGTSPLTGSNVGATTSAQNGINLPACSSAQLPKDVWFTFTPTGTSTTLSFSGSPAGMVRVFSSPSCSAGPFNQVFCQSGGAANTSAGTATVTGLTAGARYYVAVSGYGSSDATGAFTLAGSSLVTATKTQADTNALLVFPNPSNTGALTLRLASAPGAGQAALLNALGQVVRTKALAGATEQTLVTLGLAPGLYTLRVTGAGQVLTRKVVLE